MRRKRRASLEEAPSSSGSSMTAPIPKSKSKPSRLRAIFQSVRSRSHAERQHFQQFTKNNATYVIPILEAVHSAADAFPPLKSTAGGALWIARALREYRSSGRDEKAFADYLQESVARVITSVAKNEDLASLVPHVKELNNVLDDIQKDILHWQFQPRLKRFARFIKNRQPVEKYRARFDEALTVFNLGNAVSSHEKLFKITSILRSVDERVDTVPRDVAAVVQKELDGFATTDHVRRLEILIRRIGFSMLISGVFLD